MLQVSQYSSPPLPEQKKIAEILSCWDKAIEKTEKLIEAKTRLKKGLMEKLLIFSRFESSKELSIGQVLERATNGTTLMQEEYQPGFKAVTRIETISSGEINFSKVGYVRPQDCIEQFRLERGDILLSNINSLAHIGKSAIYDSTKELYHGMNLLLLRPNSVVRPYFLYFSLNTSKMRDWFRRIAKPAVNQASISLGELKKTTISIPSLNEQNKIEKVLIEVDSELNKLSKLLSNLLLQKKSLMQHLLTGKTRVKVPQ
jgi:type I restriction enzyme, S subunit